MKYQYEDIWRSISVKVADTLPIGSMVLFGGATAPSGWLICDGSEVSRTKYKELFDVIGTSYGEGNGSTTFNLPDYKGKVPVGLDLDDEDFDTIGKTGGEKKHQLTIPEMPEHYHDKKDIQVGTLDGGLGYGLSITPTYGNRPIVSGGHSNTDTAGGNQPHNNLQPYLVSNYIIKAKQSVASPSSDTDTSTNIENIYSEEETIIGYLIKNGEEIPIYRKYVSGTFVSSNIKTDVTLFGNVDEIINVYGTWSPESVGIIAYGSADLATNGQVNSYFSVRKTGTNNALIREWSSPYNGQTGWYKLFIEYTKTTDL